MKILNQYTKHIPYLYFLVVTAFWFTLVNRSSGISAYPILLLGVPFLWQLIKPSKKLNFILGITTVCLSSYIILAYLFTLYYNNAATLLGSLFVLGNFFMALWMIKNSLNRSF
ncbi:MAG: hypothetical protein ACK5NB_02360 [Flavobacteriaceae bacterium]